ncbi:MAG: hypothetical protein NZ809_00620 [Thermodesulfovibrio sp.]|nr:hypothetical protein [Thermodesulfovibrio sp.]
MDKEVIKRINKYTFILLPLIALLSYLIWQNKVVTVNVFLGGFISWLSLRELSWAVKKFFGTPVFQIAVIGLSYLKLGAIFLFLWFIAAHGWFSVKGLLIGFLVILVVSLREAYLHARRQQI